MNAILLALLTVAGVVLAVLGLTVGARLRSARAAARLRAYLDGVEDHLVAYVVEARDDTPPAPSGPAPARMMRDRLVALAPSLRGDSLSRLAGLFVQYGLVETTRRDLSARDPLIQVRAIEALAAMEVVESVPWLVDTLGSEDPLLVLASGRALAGLGATDTLPDVLAALVRAEAQPGEVAEVLLAFGAPGVPFLCERLRMGEPAQRRLSAATLGEIRSLAAAPALRAAMRDPDPEVAAAAVRALGQIGDGLTVPDMVAMLQAERRPWFVRVATAGALAALDDPASAPALADALREDQWDVRAAVAHALVAVGPAGLRAVAEALPRLDDAAVAHVAGTLDVAGRWEEIISLAAAGDRSLDQVVRRAARAGVLVRLREAAAQHSIRGDYARAIISAPAVSCGGPVRVGP
jgi:HEAT repeat protein